MTVKVEKDFKWSPNGFQSVTVYAGDRDLGPRAVAAGKAMGAIAEDAEASRETDAESPQEAEAERVKELRQDELEKARAALSGAMETCSNLEVENKKLKEELAKLRGESETSKEVSTKQPAPKDDNPPRKSRKSGSA